MNMKVDEQMTLEGLTPWEKEKAVVFKAKRKRLICSVSATQSIRRSMIKSLGDLRDKMGMYDVD